MENMNNENVIEMNTTGTKEEVIKRKAEVIKDIVIGSSKVVLEDKRIIQAAAGIGLYQGLKYGGSISRGIKGGVATLVVSAGANVLYNLVQSVDEIRKA